MRQQFTRKDNDMRWVPLGDLHVQYKLAQRTLSEANMRRIADNFDPDLFGVPVVTPFNGADVGFHIIDGSHRINALKKVLGWEDDQKILCLVKPTETISDAARMFEGINTAKKPTALDRFRVRVVAGLQPETHIHEILTSRGLAISESPHDGGFSAAGAAVRVYKVYGAEVFESTIDVILNAWDKDRDGFVGMIVQGVAILVDHPGIKLDRLADRLAKSGVPAALLGHARSSREVYRGSLPLNVARVVARQYNVALRSKRVDVG